MKKSLLVIVLIVLSATISYSQVVDSNVEEEVVDPLSGHGDSVRETLSLDYLGHNSNSLRGGRFNFEMLNDYRKRGINFEINCFSMAVHHEYHNTLKFSSNTVPILFAMGAFLLIPRDTVKEYGIRNIILGVFLVPVMIQTITNPSFRINLINKNLDLIVGINTDYFFFYDVSRIYSEATIGLRGRLKDFALSANLGIPFTKGYFENKAPYLGASAYYIF